MKKILLTLVSAIAGFICQAQMSLEHRYQNLGFLYKKAIIENDGEKYVMYDAATTAIKLFNPDHTLFKNIPVEYYPIGLTFISKYLYDSDDEIEICYYANIGGGKYRLYVITETGSEERRFDDVSAAYLIEIEKKWKLVFSINGETQVYSVPGQYVGLGKAASGNSNDIDAELYPNPVQDAATLSYTLPTGTHTATLEIFNTSGIKMRTYTVTDHFKDIIIQRGELPSGNYIYRVSAPNAGIVSTPFVIQ